MLTIPSYMHELPLFCEWGSSLEGQHIYGSSQQQNMTMCLITKELWEKSCLMAARE